MHVFVYKKTGDLLTARKFEDMYEKYANTDEANANKEVKKNRRKHPVNLGITSELLHMIDEVERTTEASSISPTNVDVPQTNTFEPFISAPLQLLTTADSQQLEAKIDSLQGEVVLLKNSRK